MTDMISTALQKFNLHDAEIAKMQAEYLPLTIAGVDDKTGYTVVKQARMAVKRTRVAVEKIRKELKEDSLKYGRAVDAEARRITNLIEPIEAHLLGQETAIDAEKDRIKREEEEMQVAKVQARIDAMYGVNAPVNPLIIAKMSDEEFATALQSATALYQQECAQREEKEKEARIAAEGVAKKMAAEREAIKKENDRLEAMRREIEEERAKLEGLRAANYVQALPADNKSRESIVEDFKVNEISEILTINHGEEASEDMERAEVEAHFSSGTDEDSCEHEPPPERLSDYHVLLNFVKRMAKLSSSINAFNEAQHQCSDNLVEYELGKIAFEARNILKQIGETL